MVKKFLRKEGGIDQYADVKITWITGRSPVLFVYDGLVRGEVVRKQQFNLADFDNEVKLHALMAKLGFKKKYGAHRRKDLLD